MTDEERQEQARRFDEVHPYWDASTKRLESKVFFWKMTAIVGIGLPLYIILQLRGCFPRGGIAGDLP
jgi:hypothetical protein